MLFLPSLMTFSGCDEGWFRGPGGDAPGSCYLSAKGSNMTWAAAMAFCPQQREGAFLAEILTAEEQEWVTGRLLTRASGDVWIGLSDMVTIPVKGESFNIVFTLLTLCFAQASDGNWKWMHSVSPPGEYSWAPGEPQSERDGPGERCVAMCAEDLFRWKDLDCLERMAPLCQYDL